MWIQVRSMDGKKAIRVDGLSKLTKIEDLRKKLVDPFDAAVERQRLFFRGKQLVDGHSLFDYNVGLNEIIQLIVQQPLQLTESNKYSPGGDTSREADGGSDKENEEPCPARPVVTSSVDSDLEEELQKSVYKLGDVIDAQDESMGAWFEAKIIKIVRNNKMADCNKTPEKKTASETPNSDAPKCNGVEMDQNENITDKGSHEQDDNTSCDHTKDDDGEKTKVPHLSEVSKADNCTDKVLEDVSEKFLKHRPNEDDGFLYSVIFETYEEDDDALALKSTHIRPRARHKVAFDESQIGDCVMVNYNYDECDRRGYWYDAVVTGKRNTRTIKELYATVFVGKDLVPMKDCLIMFRDEVFRIEKAGSQLNTKDPDTASLSPVKRQNKPECDHCDDNPKRKCKFCACCVCGDKRDPDRQLMCDECDSAYHLECLSPPLDEIPDVDEWYCPQCKNDESEVVRAGEKLKMSKKKSKMASASSTAKRDWGRGMACVGRTKMCTMVPPNHQGPVPGVEVGTTWKFRVQVSESGCHRPHVAGIHGREDDGAYSLVLSGGYEDDVDEGDQFTYTGSGGRDLSGNKRTAEQSCDQTLTRMNKALAKNCNASLDVKKGAEAKDWRAGRPVRVIRNVKGRKHSKYAPEEGNRYDGIYKVVKFWPNKGKSGFLVWRFLLRRDDPTPAPWTREGKKRMKELGLTIQYPEGYLENLREKEAALEAAEAESGGGKKRKRKSKVDGEDDEIVSKSLNPKKRKSTGYKVDTDIAKLIKADTKNEKLWQEALKTTSEGPQKFLEYVSETFMCICCQEIAFKPITTSCKHNICKSCLQRSFKAEVYSCPACRADLDKDSSMVVNKTLSSILNKLFPGYESGR